MKQTTRRVAVMAAATTALVALATPAVAAPWAGGTIPIGGYAWTFYTDSLNVSETSYMSPPNFLYDAWDRNLFSVWDGEHDGTKDNVDCVPADLADADSDGDVVMSCDDETTNSGLTSSPEIRLYSEGDLVRFLVTLTNETNAAIDYSWEFLTDYGSSIPGQRATSGTPTLGAHAYVDSDVWSYNNQSSFDAAVAWGIDGAAGAHERVRDDGNTDMILVASDSLDGSQETLAPDESATYVFFLKLDALNSVGVVPTGATSEEATLTPAAIADPASFMAEFASFDGRLNRGIDPSVVVANWMTEPVDEPTTPDAPELAATGTSTHSLGLGVAGGLALLLGAGLIAARSLRVRSTTAR